MLYNDHGTNYQGYVCVYILVKLILKMMLDF